MNWYYASEGKQIGPISESELQALVQSGVIRPDTLVWREGLTNWLPYSQAGQAAASAPSAMPPATSDPTPSGQVICSECGKTFPPDDVVRLDNAWVCASCKPAALQKVREGVSIGAGFEYASIWTRFCAKFLDGLIVGLPLLALYFSFAMNSEGGNPMGQAAFEGLAQLGFYAVGVIYNTFFIGKYGATPGKMACKIQVITANGEKVSYLRALGRYFAEIVSGLICYIGYIIAIFDNQKRSLHDHICNTRVVKRPR